MNVPADLKAWCALSCPTTGLRFDRRTLELLDTNGDGRVRTDEVLAAIDFLKAKGDDLASLDRPDPEDAARLEAVMAREADLSKVAPTEAEARALADWQAQGRAPSVAVLGEQTAAAEAALAAVEPLIDAFFTPPEDLPLVTEAPDAVLPLSNRLNPRHLEAILAFAETCVTPLLGERQELGRLDWKALKARFAPYRAWLKAKPETNAAAKAALVDEERRLRYRLHLGEFLRNFVTMDRLYAGVGEAVFQTGTLRIDARELNLCFHVESEAAHAALVGKSHCCVIYLRLARPADGAERTICAVVTAGTTCGLYVGRNGVFYDRDGCDWEATVTKVVPAEISLVEAFWSPWRKMGAGVSAALKKVIGDRQVKTLANLDAEKGASGAAAMASSVAAIGIGVGMVGAALASVMAVVSSLAWHQLIGALAAVVLVVSLPSVILAWFNLRRRDLGAVLNASGWAVNREIRFSMRLARGFTKCSRGTGAWKLVLGLCALVVILVAGIRCTESRAAAAAQGQVTVTQEAK